ncbi:mycothione reductase [Corynebacterium mendelii]|uniref:Mycothione reductase n=1 Tax=Corynebacterium mendelii TaxID=2765362 RepID=A0A939DYN9_9CORY|nr:mycothione reductase [Corynebacterium mendelii]MBN9643244.1 mycothione reductase [Corynebacterium mendelii]
MHTTTDPEVYDLIIIGTGSGNSIPGPAFEGKKIAICEKGRFGGTCLNVGCIPTKMFVLAADAANTVRSAERLGISAHVDQVDWQGIKNRVFAQRVDPIARGGESYRRGDQCPDIDVFDGQARFIGPKTIETSDGNTPRLITAETIVIAAGARPHILPVFEHSGITCHTNETIMRLAELPGSMVIVGGGFIAAEFAHVFSALGVDVTVVNRSSRLLRHLDDEVSDAFTAIAAQNWTLKLGRTTEKAWEDEGGRVHLVLDNGEEIAADVLLCATGRTPNGDLLNLDAAGIDMDGRRVKVDEFGRTSVAGVWALGDVSSPYQLKHVANAEQRAVVHNITHPDQMIPLPHEVVPSAIFTHPQIATVGMTEKQARDAGYDITVKVQKYGDVAYGWALEDDTGFAKLVADRKSGRLLGAHIIGPQASTLIHELVVAMAHNMDMRTFARDSYWIHPALPELTENAVLGLDFD